MNQSIRQILQESFIPALLVIFAIFISLIYVEYRTTHNAEAITVIRIDNTPIKDIKDEIASTVDAPQLASQENDDPRLQEATRLAMAGKWSDAEGIYRTLLADKPDSRVFNDLGVLYLKNGELQKSIEYFDKALTTSQPYVRAYFNRALAKSRLGNTQGALSDYTALVAKLPNHFDAHYNMGLLYLKLGDNNNALRVFTQAISLAGGEQKARANVGLGIAYRGLGKNGLARSAFESAIRLRPDAIEPRLELAMLENNTPAGQKRAMARFDEVFKLKPDYPPAYFTLARYHSALGNAAAAEAAYRNAIKYNPEYSKAHYNLGLLLLSQKRYTDATAEFGWIAKREPRHSEAHFNLARAAYGMKDHTTALSMYRMAIELRGGVYPEAYLNQGLVLVALKRYEEAEKSYRKAIKLDNKYPEAWYNLGLLQMKQQQIEQAGQSLQKALAYKADYEQAWFNLGVLAGREDKDDVAIDAYRHALAIRPNYPQARLNLAVRYAHQGRHQEAIQEYNALLKQDSSYALAWRNLGFAYQAIGEQKKSEQALRRSLELEPQTIKAMTALASTLSTQMKYAEAIEIMRQAVAVDAADPQLRAKLARLLLKAGKEDDARTEFEKARKLDPDNHKLAQEINTIFVNSK
ncbi:MAG TPA: tetratricopeptide repeat protein [Gammaproteobacteria bacterium]